MENVNVANTNNAACGTTIDLLAEICTQIMQRANDAAACLDAVGPHNQAIGTLMGVDVLLNDALSLYCVTMNLHRRA